MLEGHGARFLVTHVHRVRHGAQLRWLVVRCTSTTSIHQHAYIKRRSG